MNQATYNLKQDEFISEIRAYVTGSAHSDSETALQLLRIEQKLHYAKSCSAEWLDSWATAAHISLVEMRKLMGKVICQLERLKTALLEIYFCSIDCNKMPG